MAALSFLSRKQAEIDLLYRLYPLLGAERRPIDNLLSAFNEKMRLRDALHALYQAPMISESLLGGERTVRMHGFRFKFDYQRLGIRLVSDTPFQTLYPFLEFPSRGTRSSGALTNSCQGAISTLFHALQLIHSSKRVRVLCGSYWETLRFLEIFGYQVTPDQGDIVYLDSCVEPVGGVPEEALASALKRSRLLMIDTTCYAAESPKLALKIQTSLAAGVPCALLRSHMKLDCLGMEYGRLGSFSLVWGKDFPKKTLQFCERLSETFFQLARLHGNFASLRQIYPFYYSRLFHRQNMRWQEALKKNHSAMQKVLVETLGENKKGVELRVFDHGFFFWLLIHRSFSEAQRHDLYSRLFYALTFREIPFKLVASYPWDLMGVSYFGSRYAFFQSREEKTLIRISPGDLGENVSTRAAEAISEWLPWLQRHLA